MPIQASKIINSVRRVGLDAGIDSDYYNNTEDLIPAINLAVRWLVSLIDEARSKNKRVDEVLRELSRTRVYQLSSNSRFKMKDSVWTIDAVMPLPQTEVIVGQPTITQPDPKVSVERTDLLHLYSNYSSSRLTVEEWAIARNNPFMPGNSVSPCILNLDNGSRKNVKFAYLSPYLYDKDSSSEYEIEVMPSIPNKLSTIFYIVNPTEIVNVSDKIQFSENLYDLIYSKTLQFVSYSQGDNTNIWTVSDADIQRLLSTIR